MRRALAYGRAVATRHLGVAGMQARLPSNPHASGPAAPTPVVLVHGYLGTKSCWVDMIPRLAGHGLTDVHAAAYNVFEHGVEQAARRVYDKVQRLADEHGVEKVDVVAHSMGSIATLYAVTRFGLDERIGRVVTLGAPYGGSPLARLAVLRFTQVLRTARQLAPGSPMLAELRESASDITVPWTVLYSPRDELVPVEAAQLHGPMVSCEPTAPVGHVEMLLSRRVAAQTARALSA